MGLFTPEFSNCSSVQVMRCEKALKPPLSYRWTAVSEFSRLLSTTATRRRQLTGAIYSSGPGQPSTIDSQASSVDQ